MMAAFQRVGGSRSVFYVVPLLGALAVWAAFLLGRELKSPWAGAIGAVLLVSSPAFLWQVIQPMSDVAVTGCWAAALVFACRTSGRSALLSGAATAAAILVRPNLFPLAAVVASLVALYGSHSIRSLALYSLAAVPGPLAVAALNAYWHGSPLRSGYGTFDALYGVRYFWPNITRYTSWLVDTQTPVFISGFAAPFLLRPRAASPAAVFLICLGFPVATFLLYVGYIAFDTWQYLRFLLPAYPPLCAGVGVVVVCGLERFRKSALAFGIAVAVIAVAVCHGWSMARREGVFRYAAQEQRYARAVSYASGLPQSAVLVSVVYSGALHFYARRDVLRWDVLAANDLDRAVDFLRARGYPLYFIGDELELDEFTRRFAGSRTVNTLPRPQTHETNGFVTVDLQPGHPAEPAVR
jgi:hypothetical protein